MSSSYETQILSQDIHAHVGGSGTLVVLLPGWPETAEAYDDIFAALTAKHRVLALDPPGLGESAPSLQGYDTAAISRVLADAVQGQKQEDYHLVGHDVGAWISYAWAAQFPERLMSLTLLDSVVPGCSAPLTFPLPFEVNVKLWQFSFNTLPELPEILTRGRERELLDWLFDHKAAHPERLSRARRDHYVESYAKPGAMSNGFRLLPRRCAKRVAKCRVQSYQTCHTGIGPGWPERRRRCAACVDGGFGAASRGWRHPGLRSFPDGGATASRWR